MRGIPFLGQRKRDRAASGLDRRAVLAGAIGAMSAATLSAGGPMQSLGQPAVATLGSQAGTASVGAGAAEVADVVRVTIQVKKQTLVDQLHAYFLDPSSERNQRSIVEDFTSPKRLGLPRQLLEAMLIEGDLTRDDVDEFVTGLLGGYDNLVVV